MLMASSKDMRDSIEKEERKRRKKKKMKKKGKTEGGTWLGAKPRARV
jgi:hypothetical protein